LEVESLLDMGNEQLHEILQECVQELLEALVVSLINKERRENRAETSLGSPTGTALRYLSPNRRLVIYRNETFQLVEPVLDEDHLRGVGLVARGVFFDHQETLSV